MNIRFRRCLFRYLWYVLGWSVVVLIIDAAVSGIIPYLPSSLNLTQFDLWIIFRRTCIAVGLGLAFFLVIDLIKITIHNRKEAKQELLEVLDEVWNITQGSKIPDDQIEMIFDKILLCLDHGSVTWINKIIWDECNLGLTVEPTRKRFNDYFERPADLVLTYNGKELKRISI